MDVMISQEAVDNSGDDAGEIGLSFKARKKKIESSGDASKNNQSFHDNNKMLRLYIEPSWVLQADPLWGIKFRICTWTLLKGQYFRIVKT